MSGQITRLMRLLASAASYRLPEFSAPSRVARIFSTNEQDYKTSDVLYIALVKQSGDNKVKSFFENIPQIIDAASKSPLGILALLIVALAVIAFFFFHKASVGIRVGIFVLIFAGAIIFSVSLSLGPTQKQSNGNSHVLTAPIPENPACGSVIKTLADSHYLVLNWGPVDGASTYTVEVDCFGCGAYPSSWYSLSGNSWHIKRGLGRRTLHSPIYSSKLHVTLRQAGGTSLRWRVWAIDSEGKEGEKSNWCQLAFYGG